MEKLNRNKILQAFDTYVASYDLTDTKINLKYIHTKKVAANCEEIAASLNLSPEDIDICWEIGMLHDIGRFEQLKRYNTFIDARSIDHAVFGADLLFKEGLIKSFDSNTCNYSLIEKAIRFHNCYELPADLTDQELMFCQIIRDADKIDIFRANYDTGLEAIYDTTTAELKNSLISSEVINAFREHHTILRSLNKTVLDNLIGQLSLYYGLVYPKSRKMTAEQGYLWKIANFHSDIPATEEILNSIRHTMQHEWM